MNIQCANGWLFHEWKDNKCKRCGIPSGRNLTDVTWGDDPSLFGVPAKAHPVGRPVQHGSVRPLLRLVRGSRV